MARRTGRDGIDRYDEEHTSTGDGSSRLSSTRAARSWRRLVREPFNGTRNRSAIDDDGTSSFALSLYSPLRRQHVLCRPYAWYRCSSPMEPCRTRRSSYGRTASRRCC